MKIATGAASHLMRMTQNIVREENGVLRRCPVRVLVALSGVVLVTYVGYRLVPVNATTIGFAYLLLILIVASTWGFLEAALASVPRLRPERLKQLNAKGISNKRRSTIYPPLGSHALSPPSLPMDRFTTNASVFPRHRPASDSNDHPRKTHL